MFATQTTPSDSVEIRQDINGRGKVVFPFGHGFPSVAKPLCSLCWANQIFESAGEEHQGVHVIDEIGPAVADSALFSPKQWPLPSHHFSKASRSSRPVGGQVICRYSAQVVAIAFETKPVYVRTQPHLGRSSPDLGRRSPYSAARNSKSGKPVFKIAVYGSW